LQRFVITADGEGEVTKPEVEVPMSATPSHTQSSRPSLGKRASFALAYYIAVFSIGIAATLAWKSYGDGARKLIVPAASSPDQQQSNAESLDLDAVRRSIDGLAISIGASIASSQEQTARSIDQLTAGVELMTHEIAKLQAVERDVPYKNSDPPPRPAPAQMPKPVPRPSPAPTALTPARNP
jgi:hypothetical protein